MLNIAEGCGRRTDKEFCYFLFVAIGSIAEIQSALYIALDQRYLDQQGFHQLMSMADEVGRMLSGLVKHLRRKPATA
jgi:four helix bundle protein